MNEYTKGEWGIYRETFDRECEIRVGSRLIAKVQFPGHNSSEDLANAQLIASSPDLYKACVDVMKWVKGTRGGFCPSDFSKVEKALAKVES